MYELHGWCALQDATYESDSERLRVAVNDVRSKIAEIPPWPALSVDLRNLNGSPFLQVTCFTNRRRGEAERFDQLIAFIAATLPGSYGLFYERDDEAPGPYVFRVRVLARGKITDQQDPFLSPCIPVIEDDEPSTA